ncbi:MAG: disulfide bond formation protein DsbB [uncultured bacterium]|nr:MAG: disulfide bond formation protein DsbB [uncultured bacterium]
MLKKVEVFSYLAWAQAFLGMVGSLYFSEIAKLPPCNLCWYQRAAMYPLVFIITVGIIRKDYNYVWYSLPIAMVGLLIALFHNALYYGLIPAPAFTCQDGISCVSRQLEVFGFMTIPLLSLGGFSVIIVLSYLVIKYRSHEQRS